MILLAALVCVCVGLGNLHAAPQGLVRLDGNALRDDSGYFNGFGVTYFQALRHAIDNDDALVQNLSFLRSRQVNFIRMIAMVKDDGSGDWPADREIIPGEIGYWQGFRKLVDDAWAWNQRVQITIFTSVASFSQLDGLQEQKDFIDDLLDEVVDTNDVNGVPRASKILMFEVFNEWFHHTQKPPLTASRVKTLTTYLKNQLNARGYGVIPVAPSRPKDQTRLDVDEIYQPGSATIATVNFSRDVNYVESNGQAGWLPVYDCEDIYALFATTAVGAIPVSSGEPVGPRSSNHSQTDPTRLVMAAQWAWASNLPAYVYHSGIGVGRHEDLPKTFSDAYMPGLKATGKLFALLPAGMAKLANYVPFQITSGSNSYVRVTGKKLYRKRWVFAIGTQNLTLRSPSERLEIEVYNPANMSRLLNDFVLEPGQVLDLGQYGKQAYILMMRKL